MATWTLAAASPRTARCTCVECIGDRNQVRLHLGPIASIGTVMIKQPPPNWDLVLSRIEKLRTFAFHLKAETPAPADFLPLFNSMADYVLESADLLNNEAWAVARLRIIQILTDHGYAATLGRPT